LFPNDGLAERKTYITANSSFRDPIGIDPVPKILVALSLVRRPGKQALDKAIPLHLDSMENFLFRIFAEQKFNLCMRIGNCLQRAIGAADELKLRTQIVQHRMAAAPRASVLTHE